MFVKKCESVIRESPRPIRNDPVRRTIPALPSQCVSVLIKWHQPEKAALSGRRVPRSDSMFICLRGARVSISSKLSDSACWLS